MKKKRYVLLPILGLLCLSSCKIINNTLSRDYIHENYLNHTSGQQTETKIYDLCSFGTTDYTFDISGFLFNNQKNILFTLIGKKPDYCSNEKTPYCKFYTINQKQVEDMYKTMNEFLDKRKQNKRLLRNETHVLDYAVSDNIFISLLDNSRGTSFEIWIDNIKFSSFMLDDFFYKELESFVEKK